MFILCLAPFIIIRVVVLHMLLLKVFLIMFMDVSGVSREVIMSGFVALSSVHC